MSSDPIHRNIKTNTRYVLTMKDGSRYTGVLVRDGDDEDIVRFLADHLNDRRLPERLIIGKYQYLIVGIRTTQPILICEEAEPERTPKDFKEIPRNDTPRKGKDANKDDDSDD